ncbi:MAG: acyl--CoA ligase [Lachnospiraceae bacterium]|nr:acyl--CoA ligase [Lachnospiraceae bacterium]
MNRPIADAFYKNAALHPEKTAVVCDGQSVTYGELASEVSRYSHFLLENGVSYGDHIGIPMLNNIFSAILIMAANEIGIGLVPINPSMPPAAINSVFASGDVKHLIAHAAFLRRVGDALSIPGQTFCSDGEYDGALSFSGAETCASDRPVIPQITGDETLVLIMTSGSTGDPKPIDLTQNCKDIRAKIFTELYSLNGDDVILAGTPLYHTLAVRLVMLPLILGGTAVILPRFTPELWMKSVQESKVTFTIAVSSQLSQISERIGEEYDLTSLRCLVSSSAWLEPAVKERLINKMQCEFHEIYGTSEVSSPTDIDFRDSASKLRSVGKCVPGASIRIRREDGSEAAVNEIGEITAKSVQIFKGYYKRPDLTAAAFDGDYFRTGDLGYVDEDGFLYYSGRIKEIIVTGGINVYPQDIELMLLENPAIREAAAFSLPDDKLGERIAVIVAPADGAKITERDVAVACARNLADYQQPRRIIIVHEIPKNSMGKISRMDLRAMYGGEG